MARQLSLDLPGRTALGREDFFVSPANAMALAALDAWEAWPLGKQVLAGPAGAGKTHLAHVWAHDTGARIVAAADLPGADLPDLARTPLAVEGAEAVAGDRAAETALFHLHNLMREARLPLLLTARSAPVNWGLTLPDLASRMQGTAVVTLGQPDDVLLTALLAKLFEDRGLRPAPTALDWLARRMNRSFAEVQDLVARIDAAALDARRPITVAFLRGLLDKPGADDA